jgi:diaminohydroxyphosphoribosylaminopyrimidine deaminase/5-amino-6-(5-phosphoribosylamino)uracil reductase
VPFGGKPAGGAFDDDTMGRAIELARPYVGRTGENPSVGAVVVKAGKVIGRGWHLGPGRPHAEKVALGEAGPRAEGADIYVTLEPCNFVGRTPPCTEAIISTGVKRVVCGTLDPNPAVAGGGVKELLGAGLEVVVGVRREECRRLTEGYAKFITTGLPWVTVKYAMTLDGKTATRTGESFWITGEAARARVHEIRWEHSAVLVGAGTVKHDDPQLTVRLEGKDSSAGPIRVVISSDCNLPPGAKVFETPPDTWVFTTDRASEANCKKLEAAGGVVIKVRAKNDRVDLTDMLRALAGRGVPSVLVEGGSEIAGSFLDARLVDKVIACVAPKLFGGREAKTPAAGTGVEKAIEAFRLRNVSLEQVGEDYFTNGYITDVDALFPD